MSNEEEVDEGFNWMSSEEEVVEVSKGMSSEEKVVEGSKRKSVKLSAWFKFKAKIRQLFLELHCKFSGKTQKK